MANYTILLIDYEPRSIERFREPLVAAGYSVEIATDGLSGIEAFHRLNPDMVLVEAMIPKKHGFEVCQELKRTPHGRRTPVIITTGVYKGRKYRTQALHIYGCDEYIEKPITPQSLLEVVGRFFESSAPTPSPKAAEPATFSPDRGSDPAPLGHGEAGAKSTAIPRSVASDDAEGEIMARLNAILPSLGGAPPAPAQPASAAVVAAVEQDPFALMRAELDAELGALSAEPVLDSVPSGEPAPEPLPSDQLMSASVLEALPAPEIESPMASPVPESPVVAEEALGKIAGPGGKRSRQNRKAEKRAKGSALHVAQVPPPPPAPEPVASVAVAPPIPAEEVTLPRGTFVESELEPAAHRRGISVWIFAAFGVVAIAAIYFVFAQRGAGRAEGSPSPAPPMGTVSSQPEVPTTAAVAVTPPPVAAAPSVTPPPVPETPKPVPERSKPAVSAFKAPATKKATERAQAASSTSTATKPPVAPLTISEPASPARARPEAPEAAAPEIPAPAPAAPDIDANVAGVAAVPEPSAGSPVTTIAPGALIPIDLADTIPVSISRRPPVYSDEARQLGLSGTVVMNVLVNDRGTVDQVVLVTGVPGADVNEAAMRAAKSWTYRPATKNGIAVKVWKSEQVVVKP